MFKKLIFVAPLVLALTASALAQNSNAGTAVNNSTLNSNTATVTTGQCCHGGGAVYDDAGPTAVPLSFIGSTLKSNSDSDGTIDVNRVLTEDGTATADLVLNGSSVLSGDDDGIYFDEVYSNNGGSSDSTGDNVLKVELLGHPFAREAAQPPQRNLDVARVELDRVVEIPKSPLVPDLDCAPVAAFFLSDANALGIVAVGAERARSRGADPFRAALVPAALLLESLFQGFHQLVPAA